jgi:hypothetical protein
MGGAVSDVTGALGDAIDNVGQGLSQSFEETAGFIGGSSGILGQIEGGITDTVGNVSDALAEVDDAIPPEVKVAAAIYLASQGIPTGAEGAALSSANAAVAADSAYLASSALTPAQAAVAAAGSVEASQLAGLANSGVTSNVIGSGGAGNILNNAGGNMNLSDFSSALNIASSVNSLTGGGVSSLLGGPGSMSGSEAQQMADPFAPYRSNLAQMYSGALQPGTTIDVTKIPGYSQYTSGVLDPAMEASKRSAAASGLLYSGRESAALQDIGQRGYYGFMTDYLNRLAQGSGATTNPAQAAGLGLSQNTANQQAFSQGLGGLGQGIAGLYPGSSTNTMGNVPYNPSSIYSSFASPTSQYGYGVGSLLSGTSGIGD